MLRLLMRSGHWCAIKGYQGGSNVNYLIVNNPWAIKIMLVGKQIQLCVDHLFVTEVK